MKRLSCLFFVLAALAGQQAAAQTPSDGQRTTVTVGVTGRADQAAFELALQRGYFAQQGLDIVPVAGGSQAQDYVAALSRDQLQVAAGSPNAGMFNALSRGIDLRIVADWEHIGSVDDTSTVIAVRTDLYDSGAIKSPADLKGRTIAVGPSLGAYNELVLVKTLALGGLTTDDVHVVQMNFADGLAALGTKKVDAAILIDPQAWMAAQQHIAHVLVTAGQVDLGGQLAVVYFSPEFAKNKEAATRYLVGYLKGVRDYYDAFVGRKNTAAAVDTLVANLAVKDRKIWTDAPPHATDLNGKVNVASIKAQAQFYQERGWLTGPFPDIDKYIDTSFAEAAVKRIGVR